MTRNAWVTVRFPGASTAPATNTRMRFQTGAVKQGRNTDSQVASIGGTRCASVAAAVVGRFGFIPGVESSRTVLTRVAVATSTNHAICSLQHERFDHPAHRLHAVPCWLRRSGRPTAPNRAGRSCRGALLVALERNLEAGRPIRALTTPLIFN